MKLPDIELVAAKVHEAWMNGKLKQGIITRPAEDGEEQMVPYEELSEKCKEQDRATVKAVYDALEDLDEEGYVDTTDEEVKHALEAEQR